jgi:hypothetical protein
MRKAASALTIAISLAATGCSTSPTPIIGLGPWGGSQVSMQVTSDGARLEYACAEGAIEEPLLPDAEGRFAAIGTHTPGHGGPIRDGEILPTFPARYEGRLKGDAMSLIVTFSETGVEVGRFELQRGSPGLLMRCL